MRQISVGYPLITGDLLAYNLPFSVSHLFRLIAYCGACVLPLRQWPNTLRISSMTAGFNFGVLHRSNALSVLPNVAHLVKCRAFCQLVRCAAHLPRFAAHLTKCANWSNAPYIIHIHLYISAISIFLYPSIRVRTAPPVSVRVRVRVSNLVLVLVLRFCALNLINS